MTTTILIFKIALILLALFTTGKAIEALLNFRKVRYLTEIPISKSLDSGISIVIAARNEALEIESALQSVLNIDYPNYEVIIVNDRSTDATGSILDDMAKRYPSLRVVHIDTLSPGWLGKNQALYQGALKAKYDWLLFSDGDVHFHPESLKQAMSYAQTHQLDHLTLLPEMKTTGILITPLLICFSYLMGFVARPWKLRDSKSHDALGVGAFNMVRRTAYEKIGTHQTLAMEVVDDVELARHLKKHGFRSDVVIGLHRVHLWWHRTLGGLIKGLEKNSFAGTQFSVVVTGVGIKGLLFFSWGPLVGFLISDPFIWGVSGLIIVNQFILFCCFRRYQPAPVFSFLLLPLGMIFLCWALFRSMWVYFRDGGIRWRDTFYSKDVFRRPTWAVVWRALRGRY